MERQRKQIRRLGMEGRRSRRIQYGRNDREPSEREPCGGIFGSGICRKCQSSSNRRTRTLRSSQNGHHKTETGFRNLKLERLVQRFHVRRIFAIEFHVREGHVCGKFLIRPDGIGFWSRQPSCRGQCFFRQFHCLRFRRSSRILKIWNLRWKWQRRRTVRAYGIQAEMGNDSQYFGLA